MTVDDLVALHRATTLAERDVWPDGAPDEMRAYGERLIARLRELGAVGDGDAAEAHGRLSVDHGLWTGPNG